jgi:hypothetical protein
MYEWRLEICMCLFLKSYRQCTWDGISSIFFAKYMQVKHLLPLAKSQIFIDQAADIQGLNELFSTIKK